MAEKKPPQTQQSARRPARKPATRSAPTPVPKPVPWLDRTPLLEWLMASLGLLAAVGAIGYLAWEGVADDGGVPVLAATVRGVKATPHGYILDIEVANESRVTASAVQVQGLLPAGAGPEEEVVLTFDYVPGKGARQGSMTFRRDPRGQDFALQVKGQVAP